MATNQDVIRLHLKYPAWTAVDIAERLGCTSEYVRATAQRKSLVLAKSRKRNGTGVTALGRRAVELGLTLADLDRAALSKGNCP